MTRGMNNPLEGGGSLIPDNQVQQPTPTGGGEPEQNPALEMVKLKGGAEVARAILITVTIRLENLMAKNPIGFYELVQLARNPKHKLFGNTRGDLANLALVDDDGIMHEEVRKVILASVEGDDLKMTLVNPVAKS